MAGPGPRDLERSELRGSWFHRRQHPIPMAKTLPCLGKPHINDPGTVPKYRGDLFGQLLTPVRDCNSESRRFDVLSNRSRHVHFRGT